MTVDKYRSIIDLPHPSFPNHPRMLVEKRAAQFAPFAALTGYEEAVQEAARITYEWLEDDELSKEAKVNG